MNMQKSSEKHFQGIASAMIFTDFDIPYGEIFYLYFTFTCSTRNSLLCACYNV